LALDQERPAAAKEEGMQSFARMPQSGQRASRPQGREAVPRAFLQAPQQLSRAACACGGTCPRCTGTGVMQTRLAPAEAPRRLEQVIARNGDTSTHGLAPGIGSAATAASRLPSSAPSPGSHLRLALQREADTTAMSAEGEEVPELSGLGPQAAADNPEDPDAALASIERGAPFESNGEEAPAPEEETGGVQTKAASAAPRERVSPDAVLDRLGTGQPLPTSLRGDMEHAFGQDFGDVRVHADSGAGALATTLGAHAFTVGEHIAFAPGRFHPHNSDATRLVAHELTHVVQQRHGLAGAILRRGIGEPGDVYEQEAERMADRISAKPDFVAERKSATAGGASAGALQLFSGTAAAAYAKKWALSTNPTYLRFDDDCTNFVSQSMKAGGWTYIFGSDVCDERKSDSVWWFEKDKCYRPVISNVHASFTWGGAQNFFKFVSGSGRATGPGGKISDLEPGDVLQRDHGDGKMHHSMVVTKKGTTTIDGNDIVQIWLSYHTNDTEDRAFWGPKGILEDTTPGWKYFAWKIK
jgi:hypothetical protein